LHGDTEKSLQGGVRRHADQHQRYQFDRQGRRCATSGRVAGWPWTKQFFLLQLSGPATQQSLKQRVYCQAEGVGERIPVRWIGGKDRDAVLKTQVWDQELLKKSPDQFAVLACNRRLTAGTAVQLVYGKGVAGPQGVANREENALTSRCARPLRPNALRARKRTGRLPADPPGLPAVQRAGAAQQGAGDPPGGRWRQPQARAGRGQRRRA
jgi:hypothetical protein